jgi:hypothetical protein
LGLSKGEWGSSENAIKVFQAKLLAIKREKLAWHQGNYKTCFIIFLAVMFVLSEYVHVFESRIACRCNRFPSRRRKRAALSIWHQLIQSIQRGESSFQEKCMDFQFIPGLQTTWHMCVFHDQYTLTNDVLHIALCVDIINFLLEFSFEFIWIFQNINNKRFQDFSLK